MPGIVPEGRPEGGAEPPPRSIFPFDKNGIETQTLVYEKISQVEPDGRVRHVVSTETWKVRREPVAGPHPFRSPPRRPSSGAPMYGDKGWNFYSRLGADVGL